MDRYVRSRGASCGDSLSFGSSTVALVGTWYSDLRRRTALRTQTLASHLLMTKSTPAEADSCPPDGSLRAPLPNRQPLHPACGSFQQSSSKFMKTGSSSRCLTSTWDNDRNQLWLRTILFKFTERRLLNHFRVLLRSRARAGARPIFTSCYPPFSKPPSIPVCTIGAPRKLPHPGALPIPVHGISAPNSL